MFKTKPRERQLAAFNLSKDAEYYALVMDMGTGKTKVTIDTICNLYMAGKIDSCFLFAPGGVQTQFVENQFPSHGWDCVPYEAKVWARTAPKKKKDEFFTLRNEVLNIRAFNIETLRHGDTYTRISAFMRKHGKRCIMIIDESQNIKAISSDQTKNAIKLRDHVGYRRILTGTPIGNGIEDWYSQLKFLSDDLPGARTFTAFKARFCIMRQHELKSGRVFNKIVGYQNLDYLMKHISPSVFRCTKAECLDLPEKIHLTRYVELTEEQEAAYKQLKKKLFLEFGDSEVTAALAITKLNKLQQIVGGTLLTDDGQLKYLRSKRIQAVTDIIDQVQGQVIVWAKYSAEIQLLTEALKDYGVVRYDGEVPVEEREQVRDRFTSGACRVFVSNVRTGGTGLDWLKSAQTVIYYSNTFSYIDRMQSEDRTHRMGVTGSCTYVDLVAKGTIDEYIKSVLENKGSLSKLSLSQLRQILV